MRVADTQLTVITLDPVATRSADWFFGTRRDLADDDVASNADLAIEIGVNSRIGSTRPPDHVDGPVEVWWESDRIRALHESGAELVATDSQISVGRPPTSIDRWRSDRQLLFVALSWWFARHGAALLHAAAITIDGLALVIAGPTGMGKSSCVVAALNRGWPVLCDDLLVIRSSDRVWAAGIPKQITVGRDQVIHDAPDTTPLPDDERMRKMVSVPLAAGWHPVGALVAVGHDVGPGTVGQLSHHDAMACTVTSWPESVRPGAIGGALAHLGQLAGRPAYRLLHAADPSIRIERAATMLEAIRADITDRERPQ